MIDVPPLAPQADNPAEAFVRRLTGDNDPAGAVSYTAEAGQFQRAGFPVVLCGPGSIDQAHQPDEWLSLAQLEAGAAFMARLVARLPGPVRSGLAWVLRPAAKWLRIPLGLLFIAGGFLAISFFISTTGSPLTEMFRYLGFWSLAIGVFNLVPGFPLDGGL